MDNDFDVNAKNDHGDNLFNFAKSKRIAELLISQGADINAKINQGFTALDIAISNKNQEMIELLKEHGAKKNKL